MPILIAVQALFGTGGLYAGTDISGVFIPGVAAGNWQWRLKKNQLTKKLAQRIADLTWMTGRDPKPQQADEEEE